MHNIIKVRIQKTYLNAIITALIKGSTWKYMASKKNAQHYKSQNTKNLPQRYNYSSNKAMSSFKQVKCCNICPTENFKNFEQIYGMFLSASQPADQLASHQTANRNWHRAYTALYIAFKLSKYICYFHRHKHLLFQLQ